MTNLILLSVVLVIAYFSFNLAYGSNQSNTSSLTETLAQQKLDSIKDTLDTLTAVDAAPVLAEFAKELDKAGLCFGDLRTEVESIGGVFWNATSCNLIGIKTEGNRLSEELQDYNVEFTFTTVSGQGVTVKVDTGEKDTEDPCSN